MELSSARELKARIVAERLKRLSVPGATRSFGVAAQPKKAVDRIHRAIALGLSRPKKGSYRLAVRVQRAELVGSDHVESIRAAAKGEVDVAFIGHLQKRAGALWNQNRNRPLRIGSSIAHFAVTAGTLGCFVRHRKNGETLILSNNHVLADENQATIGDTELQPGHYDGGVDPADAVGSLKQFVPLRVNASNTVDCAVSSIAEALAIDAKTLTGIGDLAGLGAVPIEDALVAKVGRTTGVTRGRVTAFELDNVVIEYDIGDLQFDGQLEIEGAGEGPFSAGGDSGSLIVNEATQGVALLFAGGDQGGSNGRGLTYANPLPTVLDALDVDLL